MRISNRYLGINLENKIKTVTQRHKIHFGTKTLEMLEALRAKSVPFCL